MDWFIEGFKKFADFSGRARRKAYWMFTLIHYLISIILIMMLKMTDTVMIEMSNTLGIIYLLYFLAVMIPFLSLSVRRMHDTGRSGWAVLSTFIPFVGIIILLIFLCEEGQSTDNEYGPNPKALEY